MNKRIIASLPIAIVMAVASCQSHSPKADEQNIPTDPKDTAASQAIKPAETGYADVNGLKMYYEVYGQGKPV